MVLTPGVVPLHRVDVMKDKELKIEETEVFQILGGAGVVYYDAIKRELIRR